MKKDISHNTILLVTAGLLFAASAAFATNSVESVWLDFAPNWNLAKFIRRGQGAISETITYNEEHVRFIMSIRQFWI